MAREHITVRSRQAAVYDGTGEVTCDVRDAPHTWGVLLRCSQEELDAFRALRAGQYLQVHVGDGGVGRARLAAIEEQGLLRLAGLGFFCPHSNH